MSSHRATLLEICEFINAPAKICCLVSENVLAQLFAMIHANLMTLNEPTTNGVEMPQGSEEEEPALFCEEAYAHMELVMESLLRLVTKGDTDAKMMKKHLNTEFVSAVLGCFTSRDPRLRCNHPAPSTRMTRRRHPMRSSPMPPFQPLLLPSDPSCGG